MLQLFVYPLALLFGLTALASAAVAQQPAAAEQPQDPPVLLTADELSYDEELMTVTARGNVEVSQANRVVTADLVTYNQRTDTVTATGNVILLEPTGEVAFADYAELQGEMKDGFIDQLRVLMTDNSRLAANSARRVGGNRKEMSRVVYSPCDLCKTDPTRAPLWQIKAREVVHDEVAKDLIYRDAVMEIAGIPVAYTPYFSHPDPTVDRRSGVLVPRLGYSDDLGAVVGVPYYYTFSPQSDMTVEPIFMSDEGSLLLGEYRQRFSNGQITLGGSFGLVEDREVGRRTGEKVLQGHIDSTGVFHLTDRWRAGFDIEHVSNRTYLERYNLDNKDVLTSRLYAERFAPTAYTSIASYRFQGLRSYDVSEQTPLVAPYMQHRVLTPNMGNLGGYFSFDATALSLTRDIGTDSHRASLVSGYHLPYYAPSGEIYSLAATLQTDVYQTQDLVDPLNPNRNYDGTSGRIFPQLALGWRYPFVRSGGSVQQMIEPITSLVISPNGSNPEDISNEDSQALIFDSTNLFRTNRFSGVDRVSSGTRVDYGVNFGLYGDKGGTSTLFLGQSYRLRDDDTYARGTGLEDNLSDYVGRLLVSPSSYFDLVYRFRLDNETLDFTRNEVSLYAGPSRFRVNLNYLKLPQQAETVDFGDREQISAGFIAQLDRYWRFGSRAVREMGDDSGMRDVQATLAYADECFLLGVTYRREFTSDIGLEPDNSIFFRIEFKNLGAIGDNQGLF
ncbi:MAG: LPS assembly protein LptD [Alphaproteobacteria bacterium]|nr:LPS assembly protein LptD [Alphaproteobacteria bacterium]MBU0796674.1 LPS assembly protein LptD [Alphaproteobacteria bacterium]MBU0888223.1 LPS assembly protein LptD [Alphaproteobacteria bacterium]MBU1811424.1 LPS assembly protein LptD [Alphaproteobacteria bacterium]MBU2090790.1 LPS assembly protein LptD [Alphaproteobacteria bacterium]